jgi:hypothetical protein
MPADFYFVSFGPNGDLKYRQAEPVEWDAYRKAKDDADFLCGEFHDMFVAADPTVPQNFPCRTPAARRLRVVSGDQPADASIEFRLAESDERPEKMRWVRRVAILQGNDSAAERSAMEWLEHPEQRGLTIGGLPRPLALIHVGHQEPHETQLLAEAVAPAIMAMLRRMRSAG